MDYQMPNLTRRVTSLIRKRPRILSPKQSRILRAGLESSLVDQQLFERMFFTAMQFAEHDHEVSLPPALRQKILSVGMTVVSDADLLNIATSPKWLTDVLEAVEAAPPIWVKNLERSVLTLNSKVGQVAADPPAAPMELGLDRSSWDELVEIVIMAGEAVLPLESATARADAADPNECRSVCLSRPLEVKVTSDSDVSRSRFAGDLLDGLNSFLSGHSARVQRRVVAQLNDHLEILAAKVGATSGWLFVSDADVSPRSLTAIATFHAARRRLPLARATLVERVFRTGRSYVTGDIRSDPHLVEVAPGMRSAVSVPVRIDWGKGPAVVAILHYECLEANTFGDLERQELERSAGVLLLPLLVWRRTRYAERDIAVFDPCSTGWGLEPLYESLLKSLVRALDRQGKGKRPALALWTYDRHKECAWCVAAQGYGHEYLRDVLIGKTADGLPSVIQSVCEKALPGDPNGIVIIEPDKEPLFIAKETVRRRGVRAVAYIPVHWMDDDLGRNASCVLAVYFFQETKPLLEPEIRQSLMAFAERFQRLITALSAQRREMAIAHLLHGLALDSADDPHRIHALRRVLEVIFQAPIVTICGCPVRLSGTAPVPLSTTRGMVIPDRHQSGVAVSLVPGESPELERFALVLSDPRRDGVTAWLAKHPCATDRRLNLINFDERRNNDSPAANITNDREFPFVRGDEPRRFLGCSVAKGQDVRMVIRLLRDASDKPFRESDEALLKSLAERPEVRSCAERWSVSAFSLCPLPAPQPPLPPLIGSAIPNLLHELYERVTPEKDSSARRRVFLFQLLGLDLERSRLKAYGQHPPQGAGPGSHHGVAFEVNRDVMLAEHNALCDLFAPSSPKVVAGWGRPLGPEIDMLPIRSRGKVRFARVPVLVWGGSGPISLLLSVVDEYKPLTSDDLRGLLHASLEVAEIFAKPLRISFPYLCDLPWSDAIKQLEDLLQESVDGAKVITASDEWHQRSQTWRRPDEAVMRSYRDDRNPYLDDVLHAAIDFGLRLSRDGRHFSLPLRAGPVEVGAVQWDRSHDWEDHLSSTMDIITAVTTDFFRRTEFTHWEFKLSLMAAEGDNSSVWRPQFNLVAHEFVAQTGTSS